MLISDILDKKTLPIRASDSVAEGMKSLLDQQKETLPVIDFTTKKLVGEVTLDVLSREKPDSISVLNKTERKPDTLRLGQHILEAAGVMMRSGKQMMTVTDDENNYLGTVTLEELRKNITGIMNAEDVGSVIVIELNERDFSIMDIVRIIELEGVKILGLGVESPTITESRFRITIKLSQIEISSVVRSLERYGYIITNQTKTETRDEELHDRADELFRYLGI